MATKPRFELQVQSTTELEDVSVSDARFNMAELFNQIHYGNARVYLTRHGKRFVAIIPAALLEVVERMESERRGVAVAAARAAMKQGMGPASSGGEHEIPASTQQDPKAVVERGLKAFNAHDLESLVRDAAPDMEGTAPGDVLLKGPYAFREYNQNFITAFPDAQIEAKNVFTQGRNVIVESVFTGTHMGPMRTPMGDVPPTGRRFKGDYIQIFEIDRGLVKKVHLMYDQVQLLTQLGMAPAAKSRAVDKTF